MQWTGTETPNCSPRKTGSRSKINKDEWVSGGRPRVPGQSPPRAHAPTAMSAFGYRETEAQREQRAGQSLSPCPGALPPYLMPSAHSTPPLQGEGKCFFLLGVFEQVCSRQKTQTTGEVRRPLEKSLGPSGPDWPALCGPCRLPLKQEPTCAHLRQPLQVCGQPDTPQGFTPRPDASHLSNSRSQAGSWLSPMLVSCAKIHWLLCWLSLLPPANQ